MPAKAYKTTFQVGVYTCEITYRQDRPMKVEWSPDVPRELTAQQLQQYRDGRDALLAEIGRDLGGNVLVVET